MHKSIILFSILFSIAPYNSINIKKIEPEKSDEARQAAIQDFSKTKLFKKDSVFFVTFYDTLCRVAKKKISENNYKSFRGQAYPEIMALTIIAERNQFFLDTTIDINAQKSIPSQYIELNGKLFCWRDKHYQLTSNIINILDKYHCIKRGNTREAEYYGFNSDDALQAIDYYFCRNNLSVFKKVITRTAIGNYDPPDLTCK